MQRKEPLVVFQQQRIANQNHTRARAAAAFVPVVAFFAGRRIHHTVTATGARFRSRCGGRRQPWEAGLAAATHLHRIGRATAARAVRLLDVAAIALAVSNGRCSGSRV